VLRLELEAPQSPVAFPNEITAGSCSSCAGSCAGRLTAREPRSMLRGKFRGLFFPQIRVKKQERHGEHYFVQSGHRIIDAVETR